MHPLEVSYIIAEVFRNLSFDEISRILTVCTSWKTEGERILKFPKALRLAANNLNTKDITTLRLTGRLLSDCFREVLIRHRAKTPKELSTLEEIQVYVTKFTNFGPDWHRSLELGNIDERNQRFQLLETLLNGIGPNLTSLSLNRTKWTWNFLSDILFNKAPNLCSLKIVHGILPPVDTPFQKSLFINKKPLLNLKKIVLDINFLTPREILRENSNKFLEELFSITPNLESFWADSPSHHLRSWAHDCVMKYHATKLTKIKFFGTFTDYGTDQLPAIKENKHLFKRFNIRFDGSTNSGITSELMADLFEELSGILVYLGLVYINETPLNVVFPMHLSFPFLRSLDLFQWNGSLTFLKNMNVLETLSLRRVNLAKCLSKSGMEVGVFTNEILGSLAKLKKAKFRECVGADQLADQIESTLLLIKVENHPHLAGYQRPFLGFQQQVGIQQQVPVQQLP